MGMMKIMAFNNNKFQTDNKKYTKNRYDITNPEFNSFFNVEKGQAEKLNKLKINQNKFLIWASFFLKYPDYFIDMITPKDSHFKLYPYQRIMLRVFFRYQYVFSTLTRGASKSFVEILANFLLDIMKPSLKNSVTAAGSKQQGRDIANEKFNEIKSLFPALEKEIMSLSVGKDYLDLKTYNNSELNIVGCHNTSRGGRKHLGTIEEAFDIDVTTMNEVILPLFNVKRRTATGYENLDEFDEQVWYVTTAGFYDTDICRKQLEMLKNMCLSPKYTGNGTYFVFGSSFELPLYHGLLKQSKIDSIRKDPSFSQISFDREYRSRWIKFSDKSFFKLDVISDCRSLKYCELESDFKNHKDDFYILSYDVSRMGGSANDASIATIIRCTPKKDGTYYKNVVAIYAYEDENKNNTSINSIMHFKNQAIEIKRLADKYQVKAILIDAMGVGQGLMDFLTDTTEDEEYGKTYKPYCVVSVNGDESKGEKNEKALPLLHLMKVNTAELNNEIHNTMLGHLQTKSVRLLTNPMEAENNLEIKYGKKLTAENKSDLLLQYHQTDFLIQEMMQLEIEMKGNNVALKTMTKSQRKDRYTSLSYGIWWVSKYYEVKNRKDTSNDIDITKLFNFKKPQIRKR
jgi:hypothetical protein